MMMMMMIMMMMMLMMRSSRLLAVGVLLVGAAEALRPGAAPVHVVEPSRRATLRSLVFGGTGLVFGTAPAALALDREFSNSNVIFKDDFWYKFGKKPAPLDPSTELPGTPPFVRIQTRYEAYGKYAPKVNAGLSSVADLGAAMASPGASGAAVRAAADETLRALRQMGLLANSLFATDNVPNEVLLARFYINEAYLALIDIDAVFDEDKAKARAALRTTAASLNSWVLVVNRGITPKVGTPFPLVPLD